MRALRSRRGTTQRGVRFSGLRLTELMFIVANTGACGPLSASSEPRGLHAESASASLRASTCQPVELAPVEPDKVWL